MAPSCEQDEVESGPLTSRSTPFSMCSRRDVAPLLPEHFGDVVEAWPDEGKVPIVYNRGYNVSFLGVEKLNVFDSRKFERVVGALQREGVLDVEKLVCPLEPPLETFADVHTPEYLEELATSRWRVIQVTELPGLMLIPNFIIQWRIMRPLRLHVAGTILGAGLALERGWAINVGGGMHHASRERGAGWCPYDDLTLAVRRVRKATEGKVQKVMIVDLDAHQGNGYQRNKLYFEDEDLFVVDVYNGTIFPRDEEAKKAINVEHQVKCGIGGEEYISRVQEALFESSNKFAPDLILYNAGTDVFADDYIGRMKLSKADIIQRDELVFGFALQNRTPICMLLSGGYGPKNADVIAASIANLIKKYELS
ncbi:hypothetical protein BSKO_08660 [Bryopsis sp. KO-2023]|nr:hypothetical protein BSKO_08660 [Bryopsis sp. KO-2023]